MTRKHLHRFFFLSLAACLSGALPVAAESPAWRIYTPEPGVYRVQYQDLIEPEAKAAPLESSRLQLENQGQPVPLWVEDGGDGTFGPGDWLEFVGRVLPGEKAYSHEYSTANVYRLSLEEAVGLRMTPRPASSDPKAPSDRDPGRKLRRRLHLEEDQLLARLAASGRGQEGPDEPWFWTKLAHNRKPWSLSLDFSDLDSKSNEKVHLRIQFRALSNLRGKHDVADHRVEVSLDGSPLAAAEWDGRTSYLLEADGLEPSIFAGGRRNLELRVPERLTPGGSHPIVDVVMLNWIEIDYPRRNVVRDPVEVTLTPSVSANPLRLRSRKATSVVAYGDQGSRVELEWPKASGDAITWVEFRPPEGESSYHLVPDARWLAAGRIEVDRPSQLRAPQQADYLMIAHRRLLDASRPLAEYHRKQGLRVAVIDVQDIYDEFNHGILHPQAIRDFITYAHGSWQRPAPRFVLLVGDASWDTKNTTVDDANYANWSDRHLEGGARFSRKGGQPYDEDGANLRQLIPTWNYSTYQGHAASDNQFVAVEGDDSLPDLAIGRLPVATPEEVAQIVAKTIRYASQPEVGPWRRSALFITNESRGFQQQSDALALGVATEGLASSKVYPASTETTNEQHTRRLLDTLNEGQLLVHFLGHGGRYIWRTGPPDLDKNHDLFTLDHLEQLAPTDRLPVVLSMTCFSAPFDHPNADSIGEKLLRLADRGAIAVLGASWRNTPSPRWGRVLLEELTAPGATIGEAIQRSKHEITNRMFVETYNLLGDPAVSIALPAAGIELNAGDLNDRGKSRLNVRGTVDLKDFAGQVLVDLVDQRGEALQTAAFEVDGSEFSVEIEASPQDLASAELLRAYAWNAERGVDAVGSTSLKEKKSDGREPATAPTRR